MNFSASLTGTSIGLLLFFILPSLVVVVMLLLSLTIDTVNFMI